MHDLKGIRFFKLLVLEKVSSDRKGSCRWLCQCDCGKQIIYPSDHLVRKKQSVKSCGCLRKLNKKQHKDWTGYGDISGAWWAIRFSKKSLLKRKNPIPFKLDIKQAWKLFIKQNKKCKLSGLDLVISNNNTENTASIDRIDSSKGYIPGNIQWVHKHINLMKNVFSQNHFIEMCEKVAEENSKSWDF